MDVRSDRQRREERDVRTVAVGDEHA